MSSVELATAYVSLVPSMQGVQGQVATALAPASTAASKAGAASGKNFSAGMGGSLKGLAATLGGLFVAQKVGAFAKESVGSLMRVEKINSQTDARIKATGGAAQVSAKQVQDLADSLERTTSMEAETVQEGANLLLTFKNVRNEAGKSNDIFDRATKAAVDLSYSGFGSVESTSKQMGKALNDPIKGMSALSRSGVTFTAQQQEQIKAMVKSGDVLGAQKMMLKEVESQVGGAGEAYRNTTEGAFAQFEHQIGALGESIMSKVMPALGAIAGWLVENPTVLKIAAALIGGLLVGVFISWTASIWAANAALLANPITWIVIGIIALIAAVVIAYKKVDWFRNAVNALWAGIKIAFAAIGAAFAWLWAKAKWAWDAISAGGKIVLSWFQKLPGRLKSAASGMWDGLKNSFKSAINWVLRKWNNLEFKLGGGQFMGKKLPSLTLSTPNIPLLAAGGIVTRPTLAVVGEAGPEAVLPLSGTNRPDWLGAGDSAAYFTDSQMQQFAGIVLSAADKMARGQVLDSQWRDLVTASNSAGVV